MTAFDRIVAYGIPVSGVSMLLLMAARYLV